MDFIVAIVTPFQSCGSIDFESLKNLLNHLKDNNINKIIVGGTTGEGILLTNQEKKLITKYIHDNFEFEIIGAYINITLSEFDVSVYEFCDTILVSPPYFIKPNEESVIDYYQKISEKILKDGKKIIAYNNPSRFGIDFNNQNLYEKLYEIDNIIAIKESGCITNITKYTRWKWYGGNDDMLCEFLDNGFAGLITATGNIYSINNNFENKQHCNSIKNEKNFKHYNDNLKNSQNLQKWKNISELVFSLPSPLLIKYYLYKINVIKTYSTRFHLISSKLDQSFQELKRLIES